MDQNVLVTLVLILPIATRLEAINIGSGSKSSLLEENEHDAFLGFKRDAVEQVPITKSYQNQRLGVAHNHFHEFGSKSLPLREAVESSLRLTHSLPSRLPLRDAVEKRLLPLELIRRFEINTTIQDDSSSFSEKCQGDGYYSDPKNCAKYKICRGGAAYHYKCGNNMVFDASNRKCTKYNNGFCSPGKTVSKDQIFRPSSNSHQRYTDSQQKVVCFMSSWSFYRKSDGKFVPENIDENLCTHIVYAFASLDPETLIIKEFDPWADLDNNLFQRLTSLQHAKVLISLGGWTDSAGDKYSKLVHDETARKTFVKKAVEFLKKYNFNGLHFDWNYPVCWQNNCKKGPASDKTNFLKLLQELQEEFIKPENSLMLAASISGYKEVIDVAYDMPELSKVLEFISVMSYDYHGFWEGQTGHGSPLYNEAYSKFPQYNIDFTMNYLISQGASKEKLLAGIPFYGQSFTLADASKNGLGAPTTGPGQPGEYTMQPGMLAYFEICHRKKYHYWMSLNQMSLEPVLYYKDQWVGYENMYSVKEKAKYIKSKGFGGVVAWTIDLDDFQNQCCNGAFPLLREINVGLGRLPESTHQQDCTKPNPSTPAPPQTTTGIDSGSDHINHDEHSTWWTPSSNPSTMSTPWWTSPTNPPTTSAPWWTTSAIPATSSTTQPPTTSRSTTITPSETNEKRCQPGQYLPDTTDCSSFYRCVSGHLRKQSCGNGLHWNRDRNICDWPASAKCGVPPPSTTTPRTTTYSTSRSTTKSTTTVFYHPTTSTAASVAYCETGTYSAHKECNKFNVCVNNQLIVQDCPPGLNWNEIRGMCDWSECVVKKETLIQGPQAYSACTGNSYAAYPTDCTKYLHCLWNRYEIYQCAPGLTWNSEKNICDWPTTAVCPANENQTPVSEQPTTSSSPSYGSSSTSSTTQWEWQPSSTESTENQWEWHPPIPPTSEKPPLPETLKPKSDYFKIVCYFTNWAWYRQGIGKYLPEDIDENLCTHVVYGFAVLDFSNLVIKAHDSWADFDNQFYKRVVAYKAKGVKVTIAIGGWNDSAGDKYSRLVNDPSARRRFIENILIFLQKHNFDGLDLDWEYPKCWQVDCNKGPDSDKPAFAAFIQELSEAFRPHGYLLSSAVSPSKTVIDAGYDVPALGKYLDWVAVMTYDFHGQWDKQTGHVAPMYYHPDDAVPYFNANYSINYWISQGVPRRKIVMGMPLYGQSFRLENENSNGLNAKAPGPGEAGEFTKAAGFLAYYEICNNIKNNGWTVVQDKYKRMGPYAYKGNQWVSFDDKDMIRAKSEYIRQMDLGGGMIWALDLDDFKNRCGEGRHPLLTIIRNVLADAGTGVVQPEVIPDHSNEIEQNIPGGSAIEPNANEFSTSTELAENVFTPQTPQSTTTSTLLSAKSDYKVVCYFTNWAWYRQGVGKYLPSDIDPDLCSHIIYGFAVLDGDKLTIKPHDTWADFDNKFYEKVTAFKAKGIKVLVAIGGWNDSAGDKYSKLVNDAAARQRFIQAVIEFIQENNFDGLDLDWEYPKCWQVDCTKGPDSDKANFAEFVKELSAAFKPKGWLLSAAVSPSKRVVDYGYDVPVLSKYLDWIAVMAYDYHGQWDKITGHVAPMYPHPSDIDATFNTNFTINYWIEKGAERKKLVMGMPMYGQSFSLADTTNTNLNAPTYGGGEAGESTRARGFLAYYEICSNIINKHWTVQRDTKGRIGPYAYLKDQWVSFDDIGMIRHKSEYIKAMGLGGGMIWALDLDDFKNICGCEEYPLLRTINRVLRGYSRPDPKCVLGKTDSTIAPPASSSSPSYVPTTQNNWNPSVSTTTSAPASDMPCSGELFMADPYSCDKYYLCNQGQYIPQACPNGLYWNRNHCDWPENSSCHPDSTSSSVF